MRREDDYIGMAMWWDEKMITLVWPCDETRRWLHWYGHVMRREDDYIGVAMWWDEKMITMSLSMKSTGKRPRGRPKIRWLNNGHLGERTPFSVNEVWRAELNETRIRRRTLISCFLWHLAGNTSYVDFLEKSMIWRKLCSRSAGQQQQQQQH